jgi:hypothetical protein
MILFLSLAIFAPVSKLSSLLAQTLAFFIHLTFLLAFGILAFKLVARSRQSHAS